MSKILRLQTRDHRDPPFDFEHSMVRSAVLFAACLGSAPCAHAAVDCLPSLVGWWDTVLPATDDAGKALAPSPRKSTFKFLADAQWISTADRDNANWVTGTAECRDDRLTLHVDPSRELQEDPRRPRQVEVLEMREVESDRLRLYLPRLDATLTLVRRVRKEDDTVESPANPEQAVVLDLLRCASYAGAGQVLGIASADDPRRFEEAARRSPERDFGERNYAAVRGEVFTPIFVQRITGGAYDAEAIRAALVRCDATLAR